MYLFYLLRCFGGIKMTIGAMLSFWIFLAVVFAVIEGATMQLTTGWFALGAIVSFFCVLFGVTQFSTQVIIFFSVSIITLIFTRPLLKKYLVKKRQPTNADRCIGKTAVVTETIDNIDAKGEVKVLGQTWTARSADGEVFNEGEYVKVDSIDGVKLIVSKI